MIVREAIVGDLEEINAMGGDFIDTAFELDIPFVSSMHMVELCFAQGVMLIAEREGVIAGFVTALTMPFIGDPDVLVMAEVCWWVKPEFRGSRAGLMLIRALEKEAGLQGCAELSMFSMVGEHDVGHIYEKRGFALREKTYSKRIEPCLESLQ